MFSIRLAPGVLQITQHIQNMFSDSPPLDVHQITQHIQVMFSNRPAPCVLHITQHIQVMFTDRPAMCVLQIAHLGYGVLSMEHVSRLPPAAVLAERIGQLHKEVILSMRVCIFVCLFVCVCVCVCAFVCLLCV